MSPKHYAEIYAKALTAKRSLDRYGRVKMNNLPLVTIDESRWLEQHKKTMLPYVRIFRYDDDEYKEDCNRPVRARPPVIREIWVGARTMAALGEDDDLSEGMSEGQMSDEDCAEQLDLLTTLYNDKPGFEAWLAKARAELSKEGYRELVRERLQRDKQGQFLTVMFTDDMGEYRPVMRGDVVQVVHGSNEDLDALYMEEAADERSEHDSLLRQLTRDQVRPNSHVEEEFIYYRKEQRSPRDQFDEVFSEKGDLELMQIAASMTNGNELLMPAMLKILRAEQKDIKFDHEGKLVQGSFVTHRDYFDEIEANIRKTERTLEAIRLAKRHVIPVPQEIYRQGRENPHLTKAPAKPVLKPGQKWLFINRNGRVHDITGLAGR